MDIKNNKGEIIDRLLTITKEGEKALEELGYKKSKKGHCYICNTKLICDPFGYSPPCAWCPKCQLIRD